MLMLLSPAKSLDYESPVAELPHSAPLFVAQSTELIGLLRQRTPRELAELMDLSDTLAGLNAARYQAWRPRATAHNARQAVLAFNGDVYEGLDARRLDADTLQWLQDHLCILSGLYGVLRPLDRMQPYRLEMGTRLPNSRGADLYAFWRAAVADHLRRRLRAQATRSGRQPVLLNLASQEYFKVVDVAALQVRVVECVFEEERGGSHRIISFLAKRARGLMARHIALHRLEDPADLRAFDAEGYRYAPAASAPDRLVFRRSQAA
ncbi:MAG: peroxide stress protein YaaA [Rhodoferax sp.]|nr:peroxide stress protein YaaA [Rhodoferax sp.]